MRKRPAKLAVALGALALLCGALGGGAAAHSIFVKVGALKTTFSATIKPKVLPRSGRVPIATVLSSRVEAEGGTHIPAMKQATIDIDRSVAIDSRGVPTCTAGQLESQTTENAEAACAAALVGTGSVMIEIGFPAAAPIRVESRLLAFNGGSAGGTTTVLLHAYVTSPAPEAIVVPITLTRLPKGDYGLRAFVTIPRIAAGAGSLAAFDLSLRRQVATTGGKKHGYLLGRCSDGNFVFAPEVEFDDGSGANGLLAFGCTPKGPHPSAK
jgi:hypothetical protein